MDLGKRISERLKEIRRERNLSLDAVARLSGVSRSMLSQIERGSSSPTVSTLWNLTRALDVDFAGLIDGKVPVNDGFREIVKADRVPTIESKGEGCRLKILSPPDYAGDCELYEVIFDAGGALRSEPHRDGCEEHLTILEGAITVKSGARSLDLEKGDTACYRADKAHALEAKDGPARAILMVRNS
ncbi:XRE family transcriptional regulator [Rhizobium sp. EC-SD404]|nr:XRE family transcriptional regulator [Rhizobium sp. EC-SD404]